MYYVHLMVASFLGHMIIPSLLTWSCLVTFRGYAALDPSFSYQVTSGCSQGPTSYEKKADVFKSVAGDRASLTLMPLNSNTLEVGIVDKMTQATLNRKHPFNTTNHNTIISIASPSKSKTFLSPSHSTVLSPNWNNSSYGIQVSFLYNTYLGL